MPEALEMLRKYSPHILAVALAVMTVAAFRLYALAEADHAALSQAESRAAESRANAREDKAEAIGLRRELVQSSVELGEMKARLAAVQGDLVETEVAKSKAEGLSTANLFISQFVSTLNDENGRRLAALNSLEKSVSADSDVKAPEKQMILNYVARERSELTTFLAVTRSILRRYYPDAGEELFTHPQSGAER